MNDEIMNAATLYVTNRPLFTDQYRDSLHKDYLDMLFIQAATRPELAETIAVMTCGFTPKTTKHKLDGYPSKTRDGYAECKVSTTDTVRKPRGSFGTITINDPSQNIIDDYNKHNPDFLFPLYIDGHLVIMFSVKWDHLRKIYEDGLQGIYEKNKTKKQGSAAARNFSLGVGKWLDAATVEFIHSDSIMVIELLTKVKMTKRYIGRVKDEIDNNKNKDAMLTW